MFNCLVFWLFLKSAPRTKLWFCTFLTQLHIMHLSVKFVLFKCFAFFNVNTNWINTNLILFMHPLPLPLPYCFCFDWPRIEQLYQSFIGLLLKFLTWSQSYNCCTDLRSVKDLFKITIYEEIMIKINIIYFQFKQIIIIIVNIDICRRIQSVYWWISDKSATYL